MMKNFKWKVLLPHIIAVVIFLIVALIYCKPALEGKVLQQHDITQWKGMAQNSFEYQKTHDGHFPLWTNGMFCGMPGYQIATSADNPVSVGFFHTLLTLSLPKPICFFFLACICFYFLSQVLGTNPYIGIIGALAYAYATYNPIIISVGHDTKMFAIAYLPALIGSLLLIYEKRYWWGAAFTALFTSLLISANHPQITYYGLIIMAFMTIAYVITWIRKKEFKHLFITIGITAVAAILGVVANAVSLATTYEYSKESIRGGSILADEKSNVTKTGLSNEYALSYSLYKTEPLVLMFPRIYGGSSNNMEVAEEKSKAIEALQQMPQQLGQQLQNNLQFYWGGIDGVGTSGPPYAGAIICFLALIGFAILDDKHKWWILAAGIITILMSWGKYFEGFNVLLLKYLPMYDKFRAPSMIMVVPTFLVCLMSILTLQKVLTTENKENLWKSYKKGLIIAAGMVVLALLVYLASDFMNDGDRTLMSRVNEISDPQQKEAIAQPVRSFISGLKQDRQNLFLGDLLRSVFFMAVAGVVLWLYIRKKISAVIVLSVIGVFSFIDIIMIDSKYLNEDHYQDEADYDNNFIPSAADKQISQDTGYYRVFDLTRGVPNAFNSGALNSYFHKSIGGYHPAKLSIYQDLIEKQLYNFPNCMPVINMLNTKYFIVPNQQTGQAMVQQNPDNLGACWFVKAVQFEKNPSAVMNAMTKFNSRDTAITEEKNRSSVTISAVPDTTSTLRLIKNDNDFIEYQSNSRANQFAVFSEIYYNKGWKAYIDGNESTIVKTNYVLRGLSVPAGNHKITFEFKPASYYKSMKVAVFASALIWLLIIGAVTQEFYKRKQNKV